MKNLWCNFRNFVSGEKEQRLAYNFGVFGDEVAPRPKAVAKPKTPEQKAQEAMDKKQVEAIAKQPKAVAKALSPKYVKYLGQKQKLPFGSSSNAGESPKQRIDNYLKFIKIKGAYKQLTPKQATGLVNKMHKHITDNKAKFTKMYKAEVAKVEAAKIATEKAAEKVKNMSAAEKAKKLKKVWGKLYNGIKTSVSSVSAKHMEIAGGGDIVEQARVLKRNQTKMTKLQNAINTVSQKSGVFVRIKALTNGKRQFNIAQDDQDKILTKADTEDKRKTIYGKIKKIRVS